MKEKSKLGHDSLSFPTRTAQGHQHRLSIITGTTVTTIFLITQLMGMASVLQHSSIVESYPSYKTRTDPTGTPSSSPFDYIYAHKKPLSIVVQKQPKVSDDPFNYTAFWEQAIRRINKDQGGMIDLKAARREMQKRKTEKDSSCPKVFIYNLTGDLSDGVGPNAHNFTKTTFGNLALPPNVSLLHHTNGEFKSLMRILEWRIFHSASCLTTNPKEADLFMVPLFPDYRKKKAWNESTCFQREAQILKSLLPQLEHLQPSTACRHFLGLGGEFHHIYGGCQGWWKDPVPELQPVMRLAYTHIRLGIKKKKSMDPRDNFYRTYSDYKRFPNLHAIPYISSLHWQRDLSPAWERQVYNNDENANDWRRDFNRSNFFAPTRPAKDRGKLHERKHYMSFIGSTYHGDILVRKQIHEICKSYRLPKQPGRKSKQDGSKCKYRIMLKDWSGVHLNAPVEHEQSALLTTKMESVFCLEPGGDTPHRKSIADSIASGCIPVFFTNTTATGWFWHWTPWRLQAHVSVPRQEFVEGKIDLYKLLHTTMPLELRYLFQESIATLGRQFQYSLDDDPNDAVRLVLEGLRQESQRRTKPDGRCI